MRVVVWLMVTAGALASTEVWREARELVRLGQPGRAASMLKDARLLSAPTTQPWHRGVLGMAAAASGDGEVARGAFSALRTTRDLDAITAAALDARWMQVCTQPCAVSVPSVDVLKRAPLSIQARYLDGLARVNRTQSLDMARALMKEGAWKDEARARAERAALVSSLFSALHEGGDKAAARQLEVWVWEEMPMEPAVAYVVRGMDEAATIKERGPAGLLAHVEAMQEAHQNGEVLRLGARLCPGGAVDGGKPCPGAEAPFRCRAAFVIGKASRQARKQSEAEGVLASVAQHCPELAERALFLAARSSMAVKGAGERAIQSCTELAARFPEHALADDAWVMAGDVMERLGKTEGAMQAWQRVVQRHPQGDMVFPAHRRMVMLEAKQGKTAAAHQRAAQMVELTRGQDAAAHRWARYWKARLSASPADMIGGLEALVAEAPLSVEAALARGVLVSQGTGVPAALKLPSAAEVTPPAQRSAVLAAGEALLAMGLDQDAVAALRDALPGTWAAKLLVDAGDAASSSRWARKALAADLTELPDARALASWRLAYPLAHQRAIETAADATGTPHALLFALAREESAFDHTINSVSGAVGLFQLLPATAVTEAMTLHIQLANEAALKEPEVNARLGASYLARLMRQLHGNPALALAAYNAGPGSVRKWLAADPGIALDLFIERIPIDETREYVRRVLDSYAAYSALSGRGALVLPLRAGALAQK